MDSGTREEAHCCSSILVQCDRSATRVKAKTQAGLPGLTHITCVKTVKQDLEVSDVTGIQLMVACPDMCPEKQLEGHSTASHWASAKAG